LVTVAFTVLALSTNKRAIAPRWVRFPILGGFLLVLLLKGASPGGARARADFDATTGASAPAAA
jgi:hypothetical protein